MSSSVRRVDNQGRIALPSRWRARALGGSDEVVVVERGDTLLVRPRRKVDPTSFFDKIGVNVDPEVFTDYKKLKRALLKGEPTAVR